jgi:hypothetical protein
MKILYIKEMIIFIFKNKEKLNNLINKIFFKYFDFI